MSDHLNGRLSFATDRHDGYTENRFPGAPDYNGQNAKALRAQLLFKPIDTLDILLSASYSKNDSSVGAWQHQATKLGGPTGT